MLTIEFCGSHLCKVTNTYSCFNFEKNSKYESCKSYELEKCGEHINSQIYGVAWESDPKKKSLSALIPY